MSGRKVFGDRAVSKVFCKPILFLERPTIRWTAMTTKGDDISVGFYNSLFCVLLRSVGTQPNLGYYFDEASYLYQYKYVVLF